jgi:hypothetical protein
VSLEPGKAPIVAVISLACLLGSAVLAWLSAPATLHLTRDSENRGTAAIESRLFGLFALGSERVERIRSVAKVRSSEPGVRSSTPDRLVFETTAGPVDTGRNQQLFAVDYLEIDGFMKADGPASLTLSSLARGEELRRFYVAQAVALFMFLGGLALVWLLISELLAPWRSARG